MGRIKNTSKYKFDTVVSLGDHLIGTDVDQGGKTKNYKIGAIANYILNLVGTSLDNGVLSGSLFWVEGLTFQSTPISYVQGSVADTAPAGTYTLNEVQGENNQRIDVFAIDSTLNEVVVVEGVESENPQEPTIDFLNQIRLTSVLVSEGQSVPEGISEYTVYDEGYGDPSEYDASLYNAIESDIITIDYETPDAASGSKVIFFKGVGASNNDAVQFKNNTSQEYSDLSSLSLSLKKLDDNELILKIWLENEGNLASDIVYITGGLYGLNVSNAGFQTLNIPFDDFELSGGFTDICIAATSTTNTTSLYIDNIRLLEGIENPTNNFDEFIELIDTPQSYNGAGGFDVVVREDESGLGFIKRKTKLSEFENDEGFITVDDIPEDFDYPSTSALRQTQTSLSNNEVVTVSGYYSAGDGGGGQFYWDSSSTEVDNESTIIKVDTVDTGRFKRIIKNSLDVRDFGARLNTESDQSVAIQRAIDFCGEHNIKLIFSGTNSQTYYRIDNTITFNSKGLNVEFVGGAYIKPVDSNLLVAVVIGGVGVPSKMTLKKIKVDRGVYDGNTENIGFKFLECVQCTFSDFESRYSKYNTVGAPTFSAFAYNLFENLQNIGGYYNIEISATAPGYANENKFIGGRCFATASLHTHVVLGEYETNHNTFLSMSTEGSGQQAWLIKGGSNVILYPRTEGSWTKGSIVLDTTSGGNTVKTTRYDGDVTDLNYPDGRNQIESYYNGTQIVTAINGESSLKAVRFGASGDNPASLVHDITSTTGNDYLNEWMHTRETEDSFVWKSLRQSGSLIRSFLKTSGNIGVRAVEIFNSAWNFKPLVIGIYHLWFEAGNLLIKTSEPTSALDGKFVQLSQSSVPIGFNNSANVVNSTGKYVGKMVFDTSTNRPVFSTGSSPTSTWNFADGTVAYTPS